MVNFAERAKDRARINERNATLNSSRVNFRQNYIRTNKIHHFLLGSKGVSFGAPFDGVGLPSHNVIMCMVNDAGELPVSYTHLTLPTKRIV